MQQGLVRRSTSATLSATLALAGLTGLVGLQVINPTVASAAEQNGYVFNDAWRIQDPGSQNTQYTPSGISAATHATSSFPLNTGAVSVDALFTPNSSQLNGTNFITDGSNQGAYGATSTMLAGAPDPSSIPALGLLSNSSTCDGDLGTAGHQNFAGVCSNTGTLTLKFSKPVTDPTLDITGIGGYAFEHQQQDRGYDYARGSFNNTHWNITSPGVTFTQLTGGATNLKIANGGKLLQENSRNGNGFCNANDPANPGTSYQSPALDYAGCGSVTLQGTFSEVTFQIDAQASPWSMFPTAQYGTGSALFQNDGTKYADGVNGNNTVQSEQILLPRNSTTNTNSDLQRISLRLPQTGSLGDRVWRDNNGDGLQNDGEPGVQGATVQLLDADGNPVKDANGNPITTTTDANGNYKFTDLPFGTYKVKFTDLPANTALTKANAGDDDAVDSDADPATGVSGPVTLTNTEPQNLTVDAGVVPLGSLGDKVWRDDNGDGIQNDNEPGVSGVKVELLDKDGNPVNDANGNPITTTTDANGNYKFTDLSMGSYKVKFTDLPANTALTKANAGSDDAADSDANPTTGESDVVTLTPENPDNMTVDAGIVPLGSLGDKVWRDDNGDGIQNDNEPGVSDVKVELLDKDGNPVKDSNGNPITTTTDKNGNYKFNNLPLGDYKVKFDLPGNSKFTTANAGSDDTADSDADQTTGLSDTVSLTGDAPDNMTVDAGIVPLGSLGDKVWRDDNGDGIQNDNEPGVSDVKVELLDKDGNPVKDANGNPITTTTDKNGNYLFTDLPMGDYKVKVDLPAGTKATATSAGSDRGTDSNIDPNGLTDTVSLTPENPNRRDIDAGILVQPSAKDDQSLNNKQGTTVKVPVLGNDQGNLDPSTVKIKDKDGNPVDSLTVPGEGKWTVDPKTGDVTFTPEDGFTKNPTPINYTVKDKNGQETGAKVTVTYKPEATDDESLNNKQGTTVTVPTLKNDKGDLDPSTVKIKDKDGNPVDSLTVPGEGKWTVDPKTGDVTFTPEDGFKGNPTPINYTVKDKNGQETGAKVTVTYKPETPVAPKAKDDESLNNAQGTTVTVPVVGNDEGNLDPSTVKIIDPGTGNPVDKLVVPGEGSWTVNPKTGSITFTPEKGFTGNPTPIEYLIKDKNGKETRAKVTVTYQSTEPGVPGNPAPANPAPGDELAHTGANISLGTIAAGALLFLGGAAMLIVRRRRQH